LWSTDGSCARGALKSIWKVPKSYGGRSTMVGSRGEPDCGHESGTEKFTFSEIVGTCPARIYRVSIADRKKKNLTARLGFKLVVD
jgi:hypothetical protein